MDIPMDVKVRNDVPKYLLKKTVEGVIPHDIIYRKKMGFGAPMAHWMRGEFGGEIERVLMNTPLFRSMPFNREYIRRLIADHREGRAANELYLWILYNLAAWHDYWIEKPAMAHAA
jgi:asparagine synthase (glutamine-hydrolysing)